MEIIRSKCFKCLWSVRRWAFVFRAGIFTGAVVKLFLFGSFFVVFVKRVVF